MSQIRISKPFELYLVEDEQSATGRERQFLLVLPFETERGGTLEIRQYLWSYASDQEEDDLRAGFDGITPRRGRAIAALGRLVEQELAETGEYRYEVQGRALLVWGTGGKVKFECNRPRSSGISGAPN